MNAVVNRTQNAYVCVVDTAPYHNIRYTKKERKTVESKSNPHIGIARTNGIVATVQHKEWGIVSDHRPVLFMFPSQLIPKDVRKRVAKSIFYCPKAVKEAHTAYGGEEEIMMEELGNVDRAY